MVKGKNKKKENVQCHKIIYKYKIKNKKRII